MQKSTKLMLAVVMVCFAIMAVNSNPVMADDLVEQDILKKVKQIKRILNKKVLPAVTEADVPRTGQTTSYATGDDGELQKGTTWPVARFTDNGDGTVTDRATGLTWQQAGSDFPMTWHEAQDYVETLNHKPFAKRDNWRLPTINELMTLLTDVPRAGDLCIEPVFDQSERWLWSSDRRSFVAAWYVSADMGYVSWQDFSCYYYVRAVCSDI